MVKRKEETLSRRFNETFFQKLDIRGINYAQLKQVGGIKAMGFDKDNCLTAPYASTIYSPFKVKAHFFFTFA